MILVTVEDWDGDKLPGRICLCIGGPLNKLLMTLFAILLGCVATLHTGSRSFVIFGGDALSAWSPVRRSLIWITARQTHLMSLRIPLDFYWLLGLTVAGDGGIGSVRGGNLYFTVMRFFWRVSRVQWWMVKIKVVIF